MRAITPRYLFGGSGIEVRGVLLQPGATVQLPGPPNDGRHLPHPYPTIWSHLRGIFNIQMTKRGAGVYPGSESGTCFRSDDRAGRRGDEVTGVDRPPVAHLLISRRYEFEAAESALPGSANNFQHRDSGGVGTAYDLAAARSAMTGHLTSD